LDWSSSLTRVSARIEKGPVSTKAKVTRYSIFDLSQKLFGVDISIVREVITLPKITRLPNVVTHILGVFNLRGIILPLLDIRQLFGIAAKTIQKSDMVIVIESTNFSIGVLVDKVLDFVDVEDTQIKVPSRSISADIAHYIKGLYQQESLPKIHLINVEKLVNSPDLILFR
jgi:purine-binding chemotaxis protein CheW